MATDWATTMKEALQPHVPEEVLAVGMLQPAGTYGAYGIGRISPLLGMIMRSRANKQAGGITKDGFLGTKIAAFAVTADRVHAFRAKPSGRTWKIGDKVGEWGRDDLKVTSSAGTLSAKV